MSDDKGTVTRSDGVVVSKDPQVRLAQQREEMQKLSGVAANPNAGRIGGLPLTARTDTVQPGDIAHKPTGPTAAEIARQAPKQLGETQQQYYDRTVRGITPTAPGTLPGTIAPLPRTAAPAPQTVKQVPGQQQHAPLPTTDTAAGRVGDVREQQQHAQKIAAAIDPESQRIIEARYAALPPAEREKHSTQQAHFNDLLRLRDGQKIVGNVWVKQGVAPARDPDSGQFTQAPVNEAPNPNDTRAPWAQAPGLTAVQLALVQTGSEAEMEALYDSGTPEQQAHWDGLVEAQETAERASGIIPANELTVAELHGYTLPGFALTETVYRTDFAGNLKAARAANMTQAQVNAAMQALLAESKK